MSSSEGNHMAATIASMLEVFSQHDDSSGSLFADTLLDCLAAVLGQDSPSVVSSAGQLVRVTVVTNPHTRCSQSSSYSQYRDQGKHSVQG